MGDGVALGLQICGKAFEQIVMAGFSKLQGRAPARNINGTGVLPKPRQQEKQKIQIVSILFIA